MTFRKGQHVVIGKALGERRGYDPGTYYHGGGLRQVPLGAKAVIDYIDGEDKIHLVFEDKKSIFLLTIIFIKP
jgi:hypothetical protein